MKIPRSRVGVFVIAVAAGIGAGLVWRYADDPGSFLRRDGTRSDVATAVEEIPGWGALSERDRRRAETPLTPAARQWLRDERQTVVGVAQQFGVSPVALGGIVAAEKTLLVGRVDAIGEELFGAIFGSLRDADLARWVEDQEAAFRRGLFENRGSGVVRNPYLWTLGPAQVSFRLAIQYEPRIAKRLGRRVRSPKEVLDAVTTVRGNLEYAAALLEDAQRAYVEVANHDISDNPGVLATLYHLGAPRVRARRLAVENESRRQRDEVLAVPQVNFYGAFVGNHADEIRGLLTPESS